MRMSAIRSVYARHPGPTDALAGSALTACIKGTWTASKGSIASSAWECSAALNKKRLVTFNKSTTLKALEAQSRENTDLQAAQEIQTAKTALFAMFSKPEVKKRA